MRVKAIMSGYYLDKFRKEGDEFELVAISGHSRSRTGKVESLELSIEEQFSERWMEPLDSEAPAKREVEVEKPEPKKKAKAKSKKKDEDPVFDDEDVI